MCFKNFRHKKLQIILMFMIIMLCSLLLNASVSILTSLDKPFKQLAKECQAASAILYPYSHNDRDIRALGDQFTKLDNVKQVEYIRNNYFSSGFTFQDKKIKGFLKLTEYNNAVFGNIRRIRGSKNAADVLKDNECVLPAWISNAYNITIGDTLNLQLDNKKIAYIVKGIYSDPYNTSTAFDSDILIKKLPQGISGNLHIMLYGKDGVTGNQIEETYRKQYGGQMNGLISTLEDSINSSLISGNVVGGAFLAIGIIMLIVSCLIISFMIKNAMITDAKTIAVYKTIGYTSDDILRMYLLFYFIVVSFACAIGIVGSKGLSNTILNSIFINMGQTTSTNVLVTGIPCYILIITFVLGIIYKIINKTKKVKPIYALNGMSNPNTQKERNYKGDSKIQFSAFGIALRTLIRSKKSAVSIILTSIVTIFGINFAIISLDVAYTMKDNNDYWLGIDKSDVLITTSNSTQYDKVEEILKNDPRVNYYLKSNIGESVIMKWQKGMSSTLMQAYVYDDFSKTKLPVVKGRNPEAGNEIAIGSKIANELNKTVGDYIEVNIDGGKMLNLLITGIFQSYYDMGDVCRLTKGLFTDNSISFEYKYFSIYLKDKRNMDKFMDDTSRKTGGAIEVSKRTDAFSNIMDMIVTPQKNAIPPVVALVLLIGCINIFCIVLLKNAANAKTNGIYKCLGYSTWHLICSNLYYVGIVSATSITIAVPLLVVTYPSIMKMSLKPFGFLEYPVSYNYLHIALANLIILAVFVLSTIISSHSLKKINVRDLIQE